MVNGDKVIKGSKISKQFEGGIYEEIANLRRGMKAMYIKMNPQDFTSEEITQAEEIITSMLELDEQVESILENVQ